MKIATWERKNAAFLHIAIRRVRPGCWRCEISGPVDPKPGQSAVFFSGGLRGFYAGESTKPVAALQKALNQMSGTPVCIIDTDGEQSGRFPDKLTP